jgi:large subunit GTPase 1
MVASGALSIGIEESQRQTMSILEVDELTDFLTQAELARRDFAIEKEQFVVLDSAGSEYHQRQSGSEPSSSRVRWADQQPSKQTSTPDFHFMELSVPRRPKWDFDMDPEELDRLEKEAFLEWRRKIAKHEEDLFSNYTNSSEPVYNRPTVTPFEKNIEVWRQLWRVLDRSQTIIQIVDARNPLFYLSSDLRRYVEDELDKPMLILVNKSDFLTVKQRTMWHQYFNEIGIFHLFFSAYLEQEKIDQSFRSQVHDEELSHSDNIEYDSDTNDERKSMFEPTSSPSSPVSALISSDAEDREYDGSPKSHQNGSDHENCTNCDDDYSDLCPTGIMCRSNDAHGVETLLNREELLQALHNFATESGVVPNERYGGRIQYGFCGAPNVGKSSVINVLVGASKHRHNLARVAVAAQPGKTKHFQTLNLPDRDDMMLCDCPGLVFPSFVSSTADLIAAGVYPIAQMRDYWHVIELICQRIPREVLNAHYAITLPQPTFQDLKEVGNIQEDIGTTSIRLPPPTAEELLGTYCIARSILSPSSGVPDYQRAARVVIKDFTDGKLIYCHPPPNEGDRHEEFLFETLSTAYRSTKRLKERLAADAFDENHPNIPKNADAWFESNGQPHSSSLSYALEVAHGLVSRSDTTRDEKLYSDMSGKSTASKKRGKKSRRVRDKDPYGCHKSLISPLNDMNITEKSSASYSGVYVNAGKKFGDIPFTRSQSRGLRHAATMGH